MTCWEKERTEGLILEYGMRGAHRNSCVQCACHFLRSCEVMRCCCCPRAHGLRTVSRIMEPRYVRGSFRTPENPLGGDTDFHRFGGRSRSREIRVIRASGPAWASLPRQTRVNRAPNYPLVGGNGQRVLESHFSSKQLCGLRHPGVVIGLTRLLFASEEYPRENLWAVNPLSVTVVWQCLSSRVWRRDTYRPRGTPQTHSHMR